MDGARLRELRQERALSLRGLGDEGAVLSRPRTVLCGSAYMVESTKEVQKEAMKSTSLSVSSLPCSTTWRAPRPSTNALANGPFGS